MPDAVRFERVSQLPQQLTPNTFYFIKRSDGYMDMAVVDKQGQPVFQRQPLAQMMLESTPGLLPANALFGRYLSVQTLQFIPECCAMLADVAATNAAEISVWIGNTKIAKATFAPGSAQAAVVILQPVIPAASLVLFKTPPVQDPTLSGVVGTFAARRT